MVSSSLHIFSKVTSFADSMAASKAYVKADFGVSTAALQKVMHDWLAKQEIKDLATLLKPLASVCRVDQRDRARFGSVKVWAARLC